MKCILDIQSATQHLYNCIKSAKLLGIVQMKRDLFDPECEELYTSYIDNLYTLHLNSSLHYHRYGECMNYINENQMYFIDMEGFCSGCGEHISYTILEKFKEHHPLYETSCDIGEISVHSYTPGTMRCMLVISSLDNPYLFSVLCDDLANTFLSIFIYYIEKDIIYKSNAVDKPVKYIALPKLDTWVYSNTSEEDIVKYLIEHSSVPHRHIIDILVPGYVDELYTFVDKYINAVYTIQECWRYSRYHPDGALCKKWCGEIQRAWNHAQIESR